MIALVRNTLEARTRDFVGEIEIAGSHALSNRAIEAARRPTTLEAADELLHQFLIERTSKPYLGKMVDTGRYLPPYAYQATNGLRMMCSAIGDCGRLGIINLSRA